MATLVKVAERLGNNIKQLRLNKFMSQADLARACEFNPATMSRIETDEANVTIATLCTIGTALNVEIHELLK